MVIYRFNNGDTLERRGDAIVACFAEKRSVLSTAPLNGGRRDDLKWIFNHGGETWRNEGPHIRGPMSPP